MAQGKITIHHPGRLHRELGVPMGQTIPLGKARAAMSKGGNTGKDARYYMNVLRKGSATAARNRRRRSRRK